ncbi:lysosome-associated membrane glycoprotein 3 [Takifugu flavidus]|nr:lysosome-associated membrane glycoprotein 3 [Takifugu flavidus]
MSDGLHLDLHRKYLLFYLLAGAFLHCDRQFSDLRGGGLLPAFHSLLPVCGAQRRSSVSQKRARLQQTQDLHIHRSHFSTFFFTMMFRSHQAGWRLLLLAAFIPGVNLQRNNSSELPSEAKIFRPVLQPSESVPPIGTYMLNSLKGSPCIKVTMGVEYIITEQKTWYFNLDSSRVRVSGYCGNQAAVLSITMPDNAASLQFTFTKEKKVFFVTKLTAHLSPMPVCKKCANKTYSGLVAHDKMFKTANGKSFKCKSENQLLMSSLLQVKLVPLQIQAFTLDKGQYGKEVECWADYNKRIIPIVIGAVVVGLLLIAALTYLFLRDSRSQGYESL